MKGVSSLGAVLVSNLLIYTMEEIDINTESISGGLLPNDPIDIENRLENIFFSILDTLRGAWDSTNSAHVLLTLIFYKRILSLVEENAIDFIQIDPEDLKVMKELNSRLLQDRSKAFGDMRYALINIARQNPQLENIFAPLVVALEREDDLQHLGRVFWMLDEYDFSTQHFPVAAFGTFFNKALNSAAARAGNHHGYLSGPDFLYELLSRLACPKAGETVFDPVVGQGSSLVELYQQCKALRFVAMEKDLNAWALCKMNLIMNGIYDAELSCENALLSANSDAETADIALGHFQFGLTLETRMIKNRPYISIPFEVTHSTETDCNNLYIQLMLYKLKAEGRMLVILPITALFKDREDRKLREFLLRRDWVEAVVTLPGGILYTTAVPVAILIVNKNKSAERKSNVLFVNASSLEVNSKSKMYNSLSEEHVDCIVEIFKSYNNECDGYLTQHVAVIDTEKVIANNCNLNAKRYAAPFIRELERLSSQGSLLQLSSIFKAASPAVWVDKSDHTLLSLPFVAKEDVALSFADHQLQIRKLRTFNQQEEAEGRLVRESVLILNRSGNRIRVSFFEYRGSPILMSRQLMVFGINESVVFVEYLVLQLHTPLFEQQLNMFKSDHESNAMSEGVFAQLQIVLPAMSTQEKMIKDTKLLLLQEEEQKVENLRHRLNLDKQEAQTKQSKIISSLQHELGNRLPAILNEFKNLRDYLRDKADYAEQIDMKEPIFPVFEDEMLNDSGADNLGQVLQRIESMLIHSINSIDATGHIIRAEKERMKLQYVEIKSFLGELAQLYASDKRFSLQIEVVQDESGKELTISTMLDKAQMTTAFGNLIENAKVHGFVENKKYLICFRVGLSPDKREVIIEYKNDGRPFPKNFSFQDFISYGQYAGDTGHSGIGGYLISQIIENHDGTLMYREKTDKHDPFKVQFEIVLPHRKTVENRK